MTMSRIALSAALGAALLVAVCTPAAAGCADLDVKGTAKPGAYLPVSLRLSPDRNSDDDQGIVGFWRVTFVSKGSLYIPDDTVVDTAYVQWHSDGTEIMNSSRPPSTGSFCLGVWEKTGPTTYRLNHVALSWNPDGTPIGPASVREKVTLNRGGNVYTGTFTIVQYDLDGNVLIPTPIVGVLEGKRITAD